MKDIEDIGLPKPVIMNLHGDSTKTVVVDVAGMALSDDPDAVLVTYSLGSCLGVAIYDPVVCVGGMIHCMLPLSRMDPEKARSRPCMFVDTGMMLLLRKLFEWGVKKSRAIVKVAGAADVLQTRDIPRIGERNHMVLRSILWKNDMMIAAEDIRGNAPRTFKLKIGTGQFLVKTMGEENDL